MNRAANKGIALVAALFVLIVLALLAAVAVRLANVQHQTVGLALLGARAYHAARSGIEWGVHGALATGVCANATTTLGEGGLNGFTVAVSCTSSAHQLGPVSVNVYLIESFAYAGIYGEPDYVSRRLQATVTDAN